MTEAGRLRSARSHMTKIEFIRTGCNTSFGSFSPGDVAVVSPALAQHFIDLGCAVEMPQPVAPTEPAAAEPAPTTDAAQQRRRKAAPSA